MNNKDLINGLNYIDDDLISDAAEPPEGGKVKGKAKGGAKAPKPQKPNGGGIKVKTLVIGICAVVAAAAIVLVILFATGVLGAKVAPIYQGMVISSADDGETSVTAFTAAASKEVYHGDYNDRNNDINQENPFGTGGTDLQDEVQSTLTVAGAGEDIYYADAGDDIYITIKFYNPDYYDIISFVLSYGSEEVHYSNYMFETGSDYENIIIKLNVGKTPGIIEYAISEIKYIDGTAIKDVTMNGDTVVSCGVRSSTSMVNAAISDEEITLTSISFTADITDIYSLIEYSGGTIEAVLYDGESIISTQNLSLGKNTVTFTGLSADTLYQYAVVAYYDDLSGSGAAINYLYTNAVYTDAVVLFDDIEVGQEGITFAYNWYEGYTNSAITKLTLTANGETTELDTTALTLSGLYSDTEYTLTAYYVGTNGETTSITLTFTTLAKATPAVEIATLSSEQESIDYALTVTDTDGVGSLTSVTLTLGNTTVETYTAASGTFSGLLSDNTYTLTVVYNYDLNDGTGSRTAEVTKTITTKAKAVPAVEITTLSSEQESIDYALTVTDTDGVGSLTTVTLTLGNATVETYTAASGTFSGLLSDNTYTLTVVYTYDLNDGTGTHTAEVTKTIATKAKATPAVDISSTNSAATDSLSFEIEFTDTDGVGEITAIGFYDGDSLIESITDLTQTQFTFTGLDSEIQYTLKVEYKYDLNDGAGVIEASKTVSAYTSFVVGFESFSVLNTSAVSEGETIVVQADMYNPDNVTFTAIVINGETYSVSSVSTSKKIRAEIMNNGQFEGGNTAITISQLICTLNGKSYTVDVSQGNTAYVFINGELTVEDISVVHIVDGQYEETYYGFASEQLYYKVTLNNATCYDVDSVTIGDTVYESEDIVMSDDYQFAYIPINSNDGCGFIECALSSISYSNSSLDKTRAADVFISYMHLSDDSIYSITCAEDLYDMGDWKYYKLENDIDLTGYEWANMNNSLYGVFDGNGYTISNVSAVATYTDTALYLGLFQYVNGVVINLNVTDVLYIVTVNNSTGNSYNIYAGGIAAYSDYGIVIDNCSVDFSVQITNNSTGGDLYIGGVIGQMNASYVAFNNVSDDVVMSVSNNSTGSSFYGGVAGYFNCWQRAVVSGLNVNLIASYSTGNYYEADVYFGGKYYSRTLTIENSTAEYTITENSTVYYGVGGFEFSYSNGEYTLTGYYGSDNEVVLPDSIFGNTYSIGSNAFNGTNLVSITIPASVTTFEEYAFCECTAEIIWADGTAVTEIGNNAFYHYKGEGITIPASVTTIGKSAFSETTAEIIWADGISITEIGNSAFASYQGESITIPASVTSIGSLAFANCTAEIIWADGIAIIEIGNQAFAFYQGESITIPASVTTIGQNAFSETTAEIIWVDGIAITEIGNYAFANYQGESLIIPASVTSISSWAFNNCTAEIIWADGIAITEIGNVSFYNYKGTSIIIPDSVTTIVNQAFQESKIVSVIIGSSVTNIYSSAFYNCTSLTTVYYNGTASEWQNVSIGSDNNSYLTSATIYYYSDVEPTQSGNYWHYVDGVVTVW